MAGTTTNYSLPYPESTDLVASYPALGQDLAEDLDTILAAKVTKTAATTAPSSPATGDVWYDTGSTPPVPKFWDGSAWQSFSAGAAVISGTPTGTYTDAGVNYAYYEFTASGTLTVNTAGFADVLVVGGGGGATNAYGRNVGAGAGGMRWGTYALPAASHTVTIGAGGSAGNNGSQSSLGTILYSGGGGKAIDYADIGVAAIGGGGSPGGQAGPSGGSGNKGGGAKGTPNVYTGEDNSYTGSTVTYATGGYTGTNGTANTGNGGNAGGSGGSGIVIVRVRV